MKSGVVQRTQIGNNNLNIALLKKITPIEVKN